MKCFAIKTVGLLCLCLNLSLARAQYTLTPVAPPPLFSFNDLWHFTVTRGAADAYGEFYVTLRVSDGNNALRIKSNSSRFGLEPGSRYFNTATLADLQPFSNSFYDAVLLQEAIASGGQFPPGTYRMIYTLYGKAKDGDFTPLAEENMEATVDVMWPPILLWPEDEAVLPDLYPTLTWTPAFSSSYSGPITYTLTVKELKKGQTKEQAMLSNPQFLGVKELPTTMYAYSSAAPALQKGQNYVWQVMATLGATQSFSQMWIFSAVDDPAPAGPVPNFYAPVKEVLDNSFYRAQARILRIKYTEEYEVDKGFLIYNIYDKNGVVVKSSLPPMNSPSAGISKGDNYITLSLGSSGLNLTVNEFYTLEVMNHKNEKWYLRFLVLTDSAPN